MPWRYAPEARLQSEPVDTGMDVADILNRFRAGEHLLNREMHFLVEQGVARNCYDDSDSNAPTGIELVSNTETEYDDQAGLEEVAYRNRL